MMPENDHPITNKRALLKALIIPALGFITVMVIFIVGIQTIGLENIRQAVEDAGPLAPLVFILIKTSTYVFAPLTSGPLQFSAGILFGIVPGILYTLTGEVLGGSISFWLARRYGRNVVNRMVGEEGIKKIDEFYDYVGGWKSLIFARLILFSIYDFLSYAAGLTPIPYRYYLLVSIFIGIIPTSIPVIFGTTLGEFKGEFFIVFLLIIAVSLIPLLFHKQLRKLLQRVSKEDH